MNFDGWKGIKKLIHSTKEKRTVVYPKMGEKSVEEKNAHNLESKSPPTNPNAQQLSENPIRTEEPSTLKEVGPIKDDPTNKHQQSSSNISTQMNSVNTYVLNVLNELPEQWIGKEMNLHVIAKKKDAIWIINRVLQDVERGLINARFKVEEVNHLCDLTLTLKIAPGLASFPSAATAINPVFSFILTDIKSEIISRTKSKFGADRAIDDIRSPDRATQYELGES